MREPGQAATEALGRPAPEPVPSDDQPATDADATKAAGAADPANATKAADPANATKSTKAADAARSAEATDQPDTGDRPWRRALGAAGLIWLVSHAAYAALTSVAFWAAGPAPGVADLPNAWSRWDADWFVDIARSGYVKSDCVGEDPCAAAYFPLFPLLIRVTDPMLPGDGVVAGLIVSNVVLLAALTVLHRLVETELDRSLAERTAWYLIAFPTAFFLAAGYNHGLFLLLATGTFYFLRRGNFWAAGGVGALASATRSAGLLLLIPFAWEYIRQRGWRLRPDVLAVALVPAGAAAFMVYTWRLFNDPLAFSHAQRAWGRHLAWPWVSLVDSIDRLREVRPKLGPIGAHLLFDLWTTLVLAALVVLLFVGPTRLRRDQYGFAAYALATLLILMSYPADAPHIPFPLLSAPRVALDIFPVFVVLARLGANRWADRAYLGVALALQGALVVSYVRGEWVA